MFLGGITYREEEEKLAKDTLDWMAKNGKTFSEE